MRISDWSSDVCSSDLEAGGNVVVPERAVVGIGIEHRRRQRLQLAVGNIERRQVREHAPAHAGIAMSRELLQRRVGRLAPPGAMAGARSEEHTSELQSLMRNSYAVFCLNKNNYHNHTSTHHIQFEAE